ncbi:MAG: hypothetical protein KI786_03380, partial [Mameliella sp.]|nr:hypothetical protein [Phaeodactylibacter sp.]
MKLQPSTAFSNILCFTFSLCLFALTAQAQNPIATYYGSQDYPAWTDQIQWENQIDMSTYTEGANDFEKFEHARDALFSQGGGVLYYPGGDYDFSDAPLDQIDGRGLMLKTGVVILGETPSTDADAIDGSLNLPTRFVFPMTDKGEGVVPKPWNIIGITPGAGEALKDVSKVGVAWVEVDGAAVYFGADMSWGSTYATAGAWYSSYASHGVWANRQPDGTHPIDPFAGIGSDRELLGSGSERFVFGCKLVNSTIINDGQIDYPRDGSFGYYMYKFGARISIYGSNVFVGNNLLPASTENFFYTQNTGITQQDQCGQFFGTHESILLFDYGKTLGIDVNKNLLNLCNNKLEGYLLPNAIIRDNYIYNHGHKGLDVSGSWVVIRNNHNERDYLSEGDNVYGFGADWELTLDGFFESVPGGNGCLSDNLSRAYDLAGSNIWVTSNTWNNLGSNPGNDGESILSQRHGGTEIISWAVTHNAHLPSYSYANTGYLCGYDVHNLGMLVAWNETKGTVGNL